MSTRPPQSQTVSHETHQVMPPLAHQITAPRELDFWRGGKASVQIAYETWGQLNRQNNNVVLIMPGLSPNAHAAASLENPTPGWWESMLGPEKAICTRSNFVICINHLGSCFGSTGPATLDTNGVPLGLNFPDLSIEDLAMAATFVLDELGVEKVNSLIGPSMGGLVSLAFMLRFPERFTRALIISSAPRSEARSVAIHSLQREAICNDPKWKNGAYSPDDPPLRGMRLARKIGMSSYRSSIEWEERFGNQRLSKTTTHPFAFEFEVEGYLKAVAERFVQNFDANTYLYLSRAMDWFDVAHHGSSLTDAPRKIGHKRVDVIGVKTDTLFPTRQQELLANALQAAGADTELHIVDSLKGHDAFLVDIDRIGPLIEGFLS